MRKVLCSALLFLVLATPAFAASDDIDIPFTRFTLPNGLTVIVHEDHKAPVVAVSIWYHVGSADEPAGKTGFAHLFEHLMFSGSENRKGSFIEPFETIGATDMNGTTSFDRTNYFETVPTTAIDMALWAESDRMGHLLGAIGQEELDTQRGVVQNEKREGENRPYGRTDDNVLRNSYPANHPYQHSPIGSMADLDAASLADVKQWFNDYYGAANTTVVLAGDITPDSAREKMLKYFGDIPAGPAVPRQQAWVAARTTSTRGTQKDHVAQVRIIRSWNVAELGDADVPLLDLAADALGGGKSSRLYQRLVYKDKLADSVSVSAHSLSLASQFELAVNVKQGVDPAVVEKAVAEEWATFLAEGPTEEELERSRMSSRAGFIRSLEKVGGFGGKAAVLAQSQIYLGAPDAYKVDQERIQSATPEAVKAAANRWIAKGDYTLTVIPAAEGEKLDEWMPKGLPVAKGKPEAKVPAAHEFTRTKSTLDRSSGLPEVREFPDLEFPKIQRGMLKNGIEVVLAERHTIPVVQLQLQFNAGYASDQGHTLGTSSFAMGMLDEGTLELDSVEIARRSELLGAYISAGSALDNSAAGLNALKSQLAPSLALFADVVRNPAFRESDIDRIRGQWLAGIAQEKTQPGGIALRTLPPLLYGSDHAYGIPFTGSGTEASIKSLTVGDLRRFHRDFIRPDNVGILVAGDTTMAEITAELDRVFGDWDAAETPVPTKNIGKVNAQKKPRVFLVDRPGSPQTLILTGLLAPSTRAPNNLEIQTMNGAFGGTFTSRLNMNLREDKRWAYGASSFLPDAIAQRPFMTYASVQTDKTAESVAEVLKEARQVIGDKPLTDAEISKIKLGNVRELPGSFETTGSVLSVLSRNALYDRPDNYVDTLKSRIEGMKDADVEAAAREIIHPDAITWVIVGDLKLVEKPVRTLKLGEVKVLDVDGKVVR